MDPDINVISSDIINEPDLEPPMDIRRRNRPFNTTKTRLDIISNLPSRTPGNNLNSEDVRDDSTYRENKVAFERHAEQILEAMEKDNTLMEDDPLAEHLRMETLREMPESLTLKRSIRKRLVKSISQKSTRSPISFYKRIKYRADMSCSKFKNTLNSFFYTMELWYNSLKIIEGQFGSGVATYFKFLRWLFCLNFIVCILSLGFLVIPQLLFRFYLPISQEQEISNASIQIPKNIGTFRASESPYENNTDFSFGNLFTGSGFLTDTTLFYGFYSNRSVHLVGNYYYSIPKAYFFTIFISYFLIFIVLSVSMARSYRKSFIQTSGGLKNVFAHKIFCGWDFSIASKETATLKAKCIFNELKELLSESESVHSIPLTTQLHSLVIHLLFHILSLAVLCGSGVLMWYLLLQNQDMPQLDDHANEMMMSLVVTVIMLAAPIFFSWLVKFEEFRNPRYALYATLCRTFLLVICIITVLLAFWLQRANNTECWETAIGQEVYRLILMDFFIILIGTVLAELVRKRLAMTFLEKIGLPEFDIARNTLNLIYNQLLFWVGFYFSPLLALIIVIKLFITFHIKKLGLLHNCIPSSRPWRAAQTQTLFLVLSFISFLLVLIAYGFIITSVETSNCGPFAGHVFMYEKILEEAFLISGDNTTLKVILFVTRPGVVGLILVGLCVALYYLRAKAHAQKKLVDILNDMLLLEAQDKKYLLNSITLVTDGHTLKRKEKNICTTEITKRQRTQYSNDNELEWSSPNQLSSGNSKMYEHLNHQDIQQDTNLSFENPFDTPSCSYANQNKY